MTDSVTPPDPKSVLAALGFLPQSQPPEPPSGFENAKPSESAPAALGKYIVSGEIARGGEGVVLLGRDGDIGRDVAVKLLHERYEEDAALVQRFVEEAQIGGQLQHPGIVPVYDLGVADGLGPVARRSHDRMVKLGTARGESSTPVGSDQADPRYAVGGTRPVRERR